jgi:hypothetical protein
MVVAIVSLPSSTTLPHVDLLSGELQLVLLIQDAIQEGGRSGMAEACTAFHHAVDQRAMDIERLLPKAEGEPHESANGPRTARECT